MDALKKHIWRCNGVCRNWEPYHGWVKRAKNRAPGKYDPWFANHERKCGGVFEKIAGPDIDAKNKVEENKKKGKNLLMKGFKDNKINDIIKEDNEILEN